MFQNLYGALGECVLCQSGKIREDSLLGLFFFFYRAAKSLTSWKRVQLLSPIKSLHQEGQIKRNILSLFLSVNFLFNKALTLARFDEKVENGIDYLSDIKPGLFSSRGLTTGVEARALAFFQVPVNPCFPPASFCMSEWNVRVNCGMCLCTRRPAEYEATIHSCSGLQSCDSWVLRETFCMLVRPQLSHSSGYFKTSWASGKLTMIHQMLWLNVINLPCLWGGI